MESLSLPTAMCLRLSSVRFNIVFHFISIILPFGRLKPSYGLIVSMHLIMKCIKNHPNDVLRLTLMSTKHIAKYLC